MSSPTTLFDAARLPRLLPPEPVVTLSAHQARFGPPRCESGALIDWVRQAGVRGRGGAGFPTAVKMDAVVGRGRPVVVVNGAEGEPTSAKDRVLLATVPHLILDGALLAAAAVGACEVRVCISRAAPVALSTIQAAVYERQRFGMNGVTVRVDVVPDRYVAGEESALVHWLNGGPAKPTAIPPRPYQRGVSGRPSLIHNVETLAAIALVARLGPDGYRGLGTADDPGTRLLTVTGEVGRPGVYEVPGGTPLVTVIARAGGDLAAGGAVLVGGYFGTWLPASIAAGVVLSPGALGAVGAGLGCGAITVIGSHTCGLAEAARVTEWLATQSAGQCGPCVNGLASVAGAMRALAAGDGGAAAPLQRWLGMVAGRGACHHPDGVVRFVASALRTFDADVLRHRTRGPCPAHKAVLPTPATGGWQ